MKLDCHLPPQTKINSKRTRGLNIRRETTELLEENRGRKLHDISFGDNSVSDSKSKANKSKNKQMGLHQTKASVQQRTPSTK